VLIIASVKHEVAGEADGRDTATRETLKKFGLVPDKDVQVLYVQTVPAILSSIISGKTAAGTLSAPNTLKAKEAGLSLAGSVVASDAFFPFRDGLDLVARAGARAVIQPGGGIRENEVIAAADSLGLAMIFTGIRHFRH